MKMQFLGSGGAFAPLSRGNSNAILTARDGSVMAIDFGQTAPYIFRDEMGRNFHEIDAVYITHLHTDHIGGMEMLAFARMFMPKLDAAGNRVKPALFMVPDLMEELWESSLRGGLESIEGRVVHLTEYFDCQPVPKNNPFWWGGFKFQPVQTVHVVSGYVFKHSYGLYIEAPVKPHCRGHRTFFSSDTQFAPDQLQGFCAAADLVFHDCETGPFKSHVHAHYDDLRTLPDHIKAKMWLYHHGSTEGRDWKADGFAGFVEKGQVFDLDPDMSCGTRAMIPGTQSAT